MLVAGLLMAQTGLVELVEQGFHAAAAGHPDDGCEVPDSDCDERCPADAPDGSCPPQCDECTCCAGAISALVPAPRAVSVPAQAILTQPPLADHVSFGTHQRVFRPPRPAPVC